LRSTSSANRACRARALASCAFVAVRPITVLPSAVPVTGAARRFYR
jgi:hypothetical protein